MALMKRTQRSFAGGMIDKDLTGRQDLAKYSQGCLVLENFKVRKQGNIVKRAGTDLICDFSGCRGSGAGVTSARLVPLIQERQAGFYILITGSKAFIISPDGMKMSDGSWSRTPIHGTGDNPVIPYSADVPFDDSDLKTLDWCQSGDSIFFAHRSYKPGRIVYANGQLTYNQIQFRHGVGSPPRIASVEKLGDKWTGTGGLVDLEYAVTAVKDGVETGMSVPFAIDYNAPWDTSSSIKITIDTTGLDPDSWDCFYVYKKESDVFGLIGTTSKQTSFIDVTAGFSVGGTLFPEGFSEFDQAVHLRESGNRLATVWVITPEMFIHQHSTAVATWNDWILLEMTQSFSTQAEYLAAASTYPIMYSLFVMRRSPEYGSSDTWQTKRSPTAQKTGTSIAFSFSEQTLSSFTVRLGSLKHEIKKLYKYDTYIYLRSRKRSPDCQMIETISWIGQRTVFAGCAAKWFTATAEWQDTDGNWQTSASFDCHAEVDQTNPGAGWTAISGVPNTWEKSYASDEYMASYDSAADVVARMDVNQPDGGVTAKFTLPAELEGKKIRKLTIAGHVSSANATPAALIANGISCHLGGKNVNSFTDNYITPDLTITPPQAKDHFINPGDYPGCVQLYSQRLVYAATANDPFKFWMSSVGDIYNFDTHDYVRASDAITASTAALEMPRINRMHVHRDLMLFAEGGEWQIATTSGNAVSPATIAAKLQSTVGCAAWLKPIPIDTDIIFCDSSGETLMATRYNFATDGYESSNLSVLSQRLFRNNRIEAMAYVQFPESTIECVLADGTVASLVYMKEHEVCAWSRQVLGGGWKAKDVSANKSVINGSSHCAFVATRAYESGGTSVSEWAVLGLRDIDPNDNTLAGNLRMDAVHISDTEPTAGYGETVVRVGASKWAIGCAFTSVLKTTSPEFSDQETAQMEIKNATESEIRVIDGSNFTVRQPEIPAAKATLMKVPSVVDTTSDNYSVTPGDADCKMPLAGTNTTNGSVVVEHADHLPLSILSVTTAYRIEFANHANGGSNNGSN